MKQQSHLSFPDHFSLEASYWWSYFPDPSSPRGLKFETTKQSQPLVSRLSPEPSHGSGKNFAGTSAHPSPTTYLILAAIRCVLRELFAVSCFAHFFDFVG